MLRSKKEAEVAFLKDALNDVASLVVTSVKGLTVTEVEDLRGRLREQNIHYKVVKNTLVKKATEGTDLESLADDFKTESAIAWSEDDMVGPAKVIMNFKKDCGKFEVRAGFCSGERLDEAGVKSLSSMPSLDELRAQLLGTIQAVPAKLLAQIEAPASQIVGVLQAKKDKDEKEAA